MQPETTSESAQGMESIKPGSFFSRLGGVYSAPRDSFTEIGRSPKVVLPILVMAIIAVVSTYGTSMKVNLQSMVIDQIAEQQVAQGNMTQQQADQLRERSGNPSIAATIFGLLAAGIGSILVPLVLAGIAKLISAVFLGAENRFSGIFSVTLYVWIAVGIVHTVLFLLVLYFKNPADITVGSINSLVSSDLASILKSILGEDALPKYLGRVLGYIDIFPIWRIALLSIGYSAVSRKLKTATAATWMIAIYAIVALIGSAIPPIFGGQA